MVDKLGMWIRNRTICFFVSLLKWADILTCSLIFMRVSQHIGIYVTYNAFPRVRMQ